MARFVFGILAPLMFLTSVTMYLGDFRMVSVAFAAAGCGTHFLVKELTG